MALARIAVAAALVTIGASSWTGLGCGGEDATSEDAAATDGSTSTDRDSAFSKPGGDAWPGGGIPCGLDPDGDYLGPCDVALGPDHRSTLCDEAAGRCAAPEADCADGWCYIPPRSFLSGAGPDWIMGPAMDPAISVVDRGFYAHEIETTLGAFVELMGYGPQATTACGHDCPVIGVSIFEAMAYANRLSDAEGRARCYTLEGCGVETLYHNSSGDPYETWMCEQSVFVGPECEGYRLPSRAEWELAAGGGSPFCLPRGPAEQVAWGCLDLPDVAEWAVYCGSAEVDYRPCVTEVSREPHLPDGGGLRCIGILPARSVGPNDFGLYETLGNVKEYTQTRFPPGRTNLDIVDPAPAEPPYAMSTEPAFTSVIGRDDVVHQMGGRFSTRWPMKTCRWTTEPLPEQRPDHQPATKGFRLVRTAHDRP